MLVSLGWPQISQMSGGFDQVIAKGHWGDPWTPVIWKRMQRGSGTLKGHVVLSAWKPCIYMDWSQRPIYLSIYPSIYLFILPFIFLSIHSSFYLFIIYPLIHLSIIHKSINSSIYPLRYPSSFVLCPHIYPSSISTFSHLSTQSSIIHLSICSCIHSSICLSIHLSIPSTLPSICPFAYPTICHPSIHIFIHPLICLSIHPSISSVYSFTLPPILSFIYPFTHSIHLFLHVFFLPTICPLIHPSILVSFHPSILSHLSVHSSTHLLIHPSHLWCLSRELPLLSAVWWAWGCH